MIVLLRLCLHKQGMVAGPRPLALYISRGRLVHLSLSHPTISPGAGWDNDGDLTPNIIIILQFPLHHIPHQYIGLFPLDQFSTPLFTARCCKAHHTLCNMLHATNCNKAVTKLKQSCNTLVSTLLQFFACNMLHSVWWA